MNKNLYYYIGFPEVQDLMDLDGFDEHSSLCIDESSAYFVEKDWYDENVKEG